MRDDSQDTVQSITSRTTHVTAYQRGITCASVHVQPAQANSNWIFGIKMTEIANENNRPIPLV